jgi:hypothetical protein
VPVDLSLAAWIDRGAFLLPVLLLSQVGLAHYHLHQRLQPDPAARMLRAFTRYLGALLLALSSWAVLQTISSILLDIQSPLLPLLLASFLTLAFHRQMLKTPRNWRALPPYLSDDRSYHAFLRLVAERAAEAKAAPERADLYLQRMYGDDRARLSAVAQFLHEHEDENWIPLKPNQLAYHPDFYRFPLSTLYLAALLPVILPFLLSVYDPVITSDNLSLTVVASALASVFYSPLFDTSLLPWITALALGFVIILAVTSEVPRLRFLTPGLSGLIALALFLTFMVSYLQTYVIERSDTPLITATDYVLGHLSNAALLIGRAEDYRGMIEMFMGRDAISAIDSFDGLIEAIRSRVLALQSRLGGLFILPAMIFWGTLTIGVLWELNFSPAAQVTFRRRMRKPQL